MKGENKPATKGDIRQIVKSELRKELKRELKDVVRKKDLEKYATKNWTEDLWRRAQDYFVTKVEFYEFRDWVMENMMTKADFMKHVSRIDVLLNEVEASREGRILYERQGLRMDDQIDNHEKRITRLESKV